MAKRDIRLVATGVVAVLALVGLLAVLEQGPPTAYIYLGSSPLNTGPLGTSDLFIKTRSLYPRTLVVTTWSGPIETPCDRAVLVVVSPERPYTERDLEAIERLVERCRFFGLFIADESGVSNTLLERLGSGMRVGDRVFVEARVPTSTRPIYPVSEALYPVATFNISGREVARVRLDIASPIEVARGSEVVGYVESVIVVNKTEISPDRFVYVVETAGGPRLYMLVTGRGSVEQVSTALDRAPVAAIERRGDRVFLVVGDGSLFLNQVLRSNESSVYWGLYTSLLDLLCERDSGCLVLFDASRYERIDSVDVVRDPSTLSKTLSLVSLSQLVAMFLAKILHPATWAPPLFSWVNEAVYRLVSTPFMRPLVIVLVSLVASLVWLRREYMSRDTASREVVYRDILHFEEIVSGIRRGRVRLGRGDFVSLYNYVDDIFRTYLGTGLGDPSLPDLLSRYGVSRDMVSRYQQYMNKYMGKASSRRLVDRLYPVPWGRVTRRAVAQTLEILGHLERHFHIGGGTGVSR